MKVTVLDDYQRVALASADWSRVAAKADISILDRHVSEPDELRELLAGSEVVVAMRERTPIRSSLIETLPELRLIVTTGPYNAAIDVGAAASHGVVVSGTGGAVAPTVELTWALILGLARRLTSEDAAIRSGTWQTTVGTDLAGKTLGMVGLGRIGRRVARIGQAFGMTVQAWSQNLDPEVAASKGVRAVAKHDLFATSDVVTIHLVLSERSRGLVGSAELRTMRPTAFLINTSRGPVVDEEALAEVLIQGGIAGAGLDVFSVEPLPADHPIRSAPNTLLTPHIGYVTDGLYAMFYREIVEDIVAYMDGNPIRVIPA